MKVTTHKDIWGGTYYTVHLDQPVPRVEVPMEDIPDLDRFVCSYRDEPYFMKAMAGDREDDIPVETQWLGIRHTDGSYSVFFSLAFETYRTAFRGKDGRLWCIAVTGDDLVCEESFCAWYQISGSDFYKLLETAAKSVRERFATCRLRWEKKKPECMDLFGWCTWDSFYDYVKAEDIPVGLKSFKSGGIVPKLLILDDGWQTTAEQNFVRGHWKLSSFRANEKFSPCLKETVDTAKAYGVEKFFVWHAILGYWGGVFPKAEGMEKYNPFLHKAVHTQELQEINPKRWQSEYFDAGMIDPQKADVFYDDYHTYLQEQGVDGVKIDVQSSIAAHAQGLGGRIAVTRAIRKGMEASVQKHFGGELINCMSHANDMVYHCKDSNLMRSSGDFYPNQPESHSAHIFHNAVNSMWLSQFVWCDWDMFQTSHPYGAYHAAARAISGSPVYVSDRVDEHDFALIRSLTDGDGRLLLCNQVAMPTADALFQNPTRDGELYKIFNTNDSGAVVGVFAFDEAKKSAYVGPGDIPGYTQGQFACHCYRTGEHLLLNAEDKVRISLQNREFDLITMAPVADGFAVLGLTNKLNCGGAVKKMESGETGFTFSVADGGELLLYSRRRISRMIMDDQAVAFVQDSGFITANLRTGGRVCVEY